MIVFSIKIKHTRIRNTFNLTCFLISSLISILFLIFDSYRRDKLNLSIEVITNRFNNKYWTTTLISTQAPFSQIYKLAQQINTLNNAPKCKEIKLTKSIIKFKNKSKNKISLIGIQLESINKNIIQAKFNNNKLVMPFLNNILNYSNYLNPKFNLLSERNTAASEFSSLCAIDTPSFEPFENISRFQRYCLPKILNEHSWNTYTAHANSLDFYNRGEAYPRLGFQHILSLKDFSKLELPSNSIGLLDWPVFDEVVKNIPWENSNNFLHFVTLQSHSPFDPSNGTKYHLDMSSYFSGSIDQNILNRYANAAYEVDEFMKKSVKLLQNISLKLDVNFILYFYGDHAPPIRSNLFQDAKLLSMDARKLLVHDGTVPFGVLNIKNGILNILKFPPSENINTIADIQKLLILSLQSMKKCENCIELIHNEDINYLSSILEYSFKLRDNISSINQRIYMNNTISFNKLKSILELENDTNNKIQENFNVGNSSFHCKQDDRLYVEN